MAVSLRHQQALEAALVGVRDEGAFAQVALPLGVLLGEDVALVGAMTAQSAPPRQPDALPECALRFLLRHGDPRCWVSGAGCRVSSTSHPAPDTACWFTSAPAPSTCCGLRASAPARSSRRPSARSRPDRALRGRD